MHFRLFKLGHGTRLSALGLACLAGLAWGAACSGKEFTSGTTPSAAGTGSGGTVASGGSENVTDAGASGSGEGGSEDMPSGGAAGAPPNTGGGGKAAVGCDCAAGEYCQDGTSKCRSCTDFARLEFGTPQKLSTLSQSPSIERFARPAAAGSALFYVTGALDESKILYASSPVSAMGIPVTLPTQVESGPLFVAGFQKQNFFFDRRESGKRKLRMAQWTAPAILTDDVLVPEPLNTQESDDYSIAISPKTGHVYWMSTRNNVPELFWQATSTTPNTTPSPPAVLDLKVKAGPATCARSGEDATPWVNVAGTVLLFRNPSVNDNCDPNDSGATDLFAAPLNSDGTAKAAATALTSLNNTGGMSTETDPTLSSDACTIYFASDNGSGDFDLYKAGRN